MRYLVLLLLVGILVTGCAGQETNSSLGSTTDTGTLEFQANGEDFVRQGFVSKDGWQIDFAHVYLTMREISAYQVDPPYDASTGEAIAGDALTLAGPFTLDLAAGEADADPILIGSVNNAPTGHFNALTWRMVPAAEGSAAGYTLSLQGAATKDGQTISFNLNIEEEYSYTCGEYIGDERKGFLAANGTTAVEATFHFDHIFGDADSPLNDSLNAGALGFDSLAAAAKNGILETDLAGLTEALSAAEMTTLREALATLGHVGEGHCYETTGGFTGHESN